MRRKLRFFIAILLHSYFQFGDAVPCDIIGGRSELILDLTESLGEAYDQPIEPQELPIEGDEGSEIDLELSGVREKRFSLTGKKLSLTKPLDRDETNLSTLRFEIRCIVRSSQQIRSIPVVARIRDINDNSPEFKGAPYLVAVREDASVNSPIFNGIRAEDRDSGRNGQVEYEVVDVTPSGNGSDPVFSIRFPHQGAVFLMAPLDYETTPLYHVTVLATDYSEKKEERRNTTTTLTVRIQDVDDQDPVFDTAAVPPSSCSPPANAAAFDCMPQYQSSVIEGEIAGVLDVYPGRIHAKDVDTLGAPIIYSFKSGVPTSYEEYFKIDQRSAGITQIKEVDRTQIKNFDIVIEALEKTPRRGRTMSRLLINVQNVDTSPPKLVIPAYTGKVLEASRPGTPVLSDDGSEAPFVLSVFDPDLEPDEAVSYVFELTTSAFEINKDGGLVVASPNLDRDPPNLPQHTFQVIAREDREGGSASTPVTLTVRLLDINDNPPRIPILPSVTIPAGSSHRSVTEIKATDSDEGENANVKYELLNGSRGKFVIDEDSGMITAVGNLEAAEKFFLRFKATDYGGLSSEGFLEIVVSKGPNTDGPVFSKAKYSTVVREDIPYGEEILKVQARDPENDVSYYSITKGNPRKAFGVDTLTGLITVVAPLDREKHSEHTLVITAEDSEGKNNTAQVLIQVTDVNDETPSFVGEPYSFRVDEGAANASVGVIKAEDNDLGVFGEVLYFLEKNANHFRINSKTGQLFTNSSLDYEKDQVHFVSVMAHDMADDPRSATTTVTVLVNDLRDEEPFFPRTKYRVQVRENTAIGSVVTTVVANDMDTAPEITYKMVEGDSHLFRVAPDTGRVTVAGTLDYEAAANHTVVIGTEENPGEEKGARTTVVVEVEDVNDATPTIDPIHTVTLAKEAPVGTLVKNISAFDADGTYPNNKIKFSLVDNGDITSYFGIDEKGEIRLKKLLSDTDFTELTIKLTASDQGEPPLSTSTEFRILLLQGVVETFGESSAGTLGSDGVGGSHSALASSPRFSKENFELKVNENVPIGTVVVKVPLANTTASSILCSIVNGNENDTFITKVTLDGNCKVVTTKDLDFEERSSFSLSLALLPEGFAVDEDQNIPVLSEAFIQISIQDMNDNSPTFILKGIDILQNYPQTTVLSYVLEDSPVDSKIIELKALDLDSDRKGAIEYKLLPETNRGNYFSVDPKTGRIYTKRKLQNVPMELIPFNLSLIARDKPGMNGTQHSTIINVIVPVVEESHQMVLVFDSPREGVKPQLDNIRKGISEATGQTAQIERLVQERRSSKRETHLWFHLLEPESWKPVTPSYLLEGKEKEVLLQSIARSAPTLSALQLVSPAALRQQKTKEGDKLEAILESKRGRNDEVLRVNTALLALNPLEYALIALSVIIILFVLCAIVLVCLLWSRFSKKWNSADKTVMLVPPMMERPASVLESVSKEYEVQVLHMSMPMDDDSVQEVPMETESPRQTYLDNVSYISKSHTGMEGSSSGESSGIATPNPVGMDPTGVEAFSSWSPDAVVSGEHFSSTRLDGDPNGMSASSTNANVMFARRGFGDPSPVETTTEL